MSPDDTFLFEVGSLTEPEPWCFNLVGWLVKPWICLFLHPQHWGYRCAPLHRIWRYWTSQFRFLCLQSPLSHLPDPWDAVYVFSVPGLPTSLQCLADRQPSLTHGAVSLFRSDSGNPYFSQRFIAECFKIESSWSIFK